MRLSVLPLTVPLLLAVSACSQNPGPARAAAPRVADPPPPVAAAAEAPTFAMDLTGVWTGTVQYQGDEITLDINLQRGATGRYTGSAQPRGEDSAALRELHLDGDHLMMVFAAPDGPASFDMMLTADRQAFTGTISYQNQSITFTARKRPR